MRNRIFIPDDQGCHAPTKIKFHVLSHALSVFLGQSGWGTPRPGQDGAPPSPGQDGVPPLARTGWGTPQDGGTSPPWTGYATGGTPPGVSRRRTALF